MEIFWWTCFDPTIDHICGIVSAGSSSMAKILQYFFEARHCVWTPCGARPMRSASSITRWTKQGLTKQGSICHGSTAPIGPTETKWSEPHEPIFSRRLLLLGGQYQWQGKKLPILVNLKVSQRKYILGPFMVVFGTNTQAKERNLDWLTFPRRWSKGGQSKSKPCVKEKVWQQEEANDGRVDDHQLEQQG